MAGVRVLGDTGEISFAITADKTIAQIVAAANHQVRVERIGVSFKGTSGAEAPVLVQLLRQTSAGTMTGLTLRPANTGDGETVEVTGLHTATAEPTDSGEVKGSKLIHPQSNYDFVFLPGRDLFINGGDRLGILVIAPTQAGVIAVSFEVEE